MDPILKKNKIIIEWLQEKYKEGSEVVSLCRVVNFLAEAGLLNGTHFIMFQLLKTPYQVRNMTVSPPTLLQQLLEKIRRRYEEGTGMIRPLNVLPAMIRNECAREENQKSSSTNR